MTESMFSRKENIKVLGLIIRVARVKKGYSLRALAEIAKISHTLISNIEKGKIIANLDTINEIFNILDLQFHSGEELTQEFNEKYENIYNHLFYYEYDKAYKIVEGLDKDKDIYQHSTEVVNYEIIRCMYYKMANKVAPNCVLLDYYGDYLDYFNDVQKQLYYFIQGIDFVNRELYRDGRLAFEKCLTFQDTRLNILINEYYAITLSKSNKYVDAKEISDMAISQYEHEVNYIRAMRVRTRIAFDLIRIHKFKEANEMYQKVKEFSIKYKVKDLENRCNTFLGYLATYVRDYKLAEKYLSLVEEPRVRHYYYLKLFIAPFNRNDEEFYKLYEECKNLPSIKRSYKAERFVEIYYFRYDEKNMDKVKYEKYLKEIINDGFESDDGEIIDRATMMLAEYYQKERKYKLAYEAYHRLLQFLKYGT